MSASICGEKNMVCAFNTRTLSKESRPKITSDSVFRVRVQSPETELRDHYETHYEYALGGSDAYSHFTSLVCIRNGF